MHCVTKNAKGSSRGEELAGFGEKAIVPANPSLCGIWGEEGGSRCRTVHCRRKEEVEVAPEGEEGGSRGVFFAPLAPRRRWRSRRHGGECLGHSGLDLTCRLRWRLNGGGNSNDGCGGAWSAALEEAECTWRPYFWQPSLISLYFRRPLPILPYIRRPSLHGWERKRNLDPWTSFSWPKLKPSEPTMKYWNRS
jgi:hypothetical protein